MCGDTCQHPRDLRQEDGDLEDSLGYKVNKVEEMGIYLHRCLSTMNETLGSTPSASDIMRQRNEPILPSYVFSDKWVCLSNSVSSSAK